MARTWQARRSGMRRISCAAGGAESPVKTGPNHGDRQRRMREADMSQVAPFETEEQQAEQPAGDAGGDRLAPESGTGGESGGPRGGGWGGTHFPLAPLASPVCVDRCLLGGRA